MRNAPPWTGSSATATRRWQRWKKRRWSSSLTTPSAVSSPIWTPSGYGSTSARRCTARCWKLWISARRSTRLCESSASPPSRVTAAVFCSIRRRFRRCRPGSNSMRGIAVFSHIYVCFEYNTYDYKVKNTITDKHPVSFFAFDPVLTQNPKKAGRAGRKQ